MTFCPILQHLLAQYFCEPAFRTGDPKAVSAMYTLLCHRSQFSPAKIRRQLESEFGTRISPDVSMADAMEITPTDEEDILVAKSIKRQMLAKLLGGMF